MFRILSQGRRMYANLKNFDNLEALNLHLSTNKFPITLVYFRANWNPNCLLTDQHAIQLAGQDPSLQLIKVDTDVAPKIARHYGVKAEPQFVFCLYGDEVIRQTGPNYQGLLKKLEMVVELGKTAEFSGIKDKWVPYGSRFEKYYQQRLQNLYKTNINSF